MVHSKMDFYRPEMLHYTHEVNTHFLRELIPKLHSQVCPVLYESVPSNSVISLDSATPVTPPFTIQTLAPSEASQDQGNKVSNTFVLFEILDIFSPFKQKIQCE